VDAVDISTDAHRRATQRFRLRLADRINLIRSILRQPSGKSYDLIISNPPYVTSIDETCRPRMTQPALALAGGGDGFRRGAHDSRRHRA
jgi:methylase of polypeptide subunit release factors